MISEIARRDSAAKRPIKPFLLGGIGLVALSLAMATGASPAAAKYLLKYRSWRKEAQHSRLPFGDIPKGPLEIFVSVNQQRLHFYSDGVHVADAPVATGVPGHLTPLGIFSVIQRDRYHHSNIYDNAPMPYMERITWSGVALHEGEGVGHEASHGCIRMPHSFAARLWMLPTLGMRVIVARPELRPVDFADPHLFVHKDASIAALPPATETAQSVAPGTKSDVVIGSTATSAAKTSPAKDPVSTPSDGASSVGSAGVSQAGDSPPAAANTPASAVAPNGAPATAGGGTATNTTPPNNATSAQPGNAGPSAPAPAVPAEAATAGTGSADISAPIDIDDVPLPPTRPPQFGAASGNPIAIFISRKESKIYVRQNFTPLFDAPVTIEDPSQPLGTHVFTAMDYLPDHSTFHWTVVTLPATQTKRVERWKYVWDDWGRRRRVRVEQQLAEPAPQETPQEALARIQIPQDVINQISQLIIPGSSMIISDQGLGPETGRGTDFIVITR